MTDLLKIEGNHIVVSKIIGLVPLYENDDPEKGLVGTCIVTAVKPFVVKAQPDAVADILAELGMNTLDYAEAVAKKQANALKSQIETK